MIFLSLVANVKFEAKPAGELLTQPQRHGAELDFPIPVEDFAFSLHDLSAEGSYLAQASAAIVFCVDGEAVLRKGDQSLTLKPASRPSWPPVNRRCRSAAAAAWRAFSIKAPVSD